MKLRGVDYVAIILASGLMAMMSLVMLAVILNIVQHHNPTPTLGENTAQVLVGAVSSVLGVLGSYVGFSVVHLRRDSGDFPGQRREEKSRLSEPETRIMEPWPGEKKEE